MSDLDKLVERVRQSTAWDFEKFPPDPPHMRPTGAWCIEARRLILNLADALVVERGKVERVRAVLNTKHDCDKVEMLMLWGAARFIVNEEEASDGT